MTVIFSWCVWALVLLVGWYLSRSGSSASSPNWEKPPAIPSYEWPLTVPTSERIPTPKIIKKPGNYTEAEVASLGDDVGSLPSVANHRVRVL